MQSSERTSAGSELWREVVVGPYSEKTVASLELRKDEG